MRSSWKGLFWDNHIERLRKKILAGVFIKGSNIGNIMSRRSAIPAEFVGYSVGIHTGLVFRTINIITAMIGYKFGEFVFTKVMGEAVHKLAYQEREQKRALKALASRQKRKSKRVKMKTIKKRRKK